MVILTNRTMEAFFRSAHYDRRTRLNILSRTFGRQTQPVRLPF
jgi:hypothetical protein